MAGNNQDLQIDLAAGRCHFLQSHVWAEARARAGWSHEVEHLDLANGKQLPVIIYRRKIPLLGTVAYAPKVGGITSADIKNLGDLAAKNRKKSDIVFKLELDVPEDEKLTKDFQKAGWATGYPVQYSATVNIDLTKSEEDLMMDVKPKDRRKIRFAPKSGVKAVMVEPTDENLEKLYNLMTKTSDRKGFAMRGKNLMMDYWKAYVDAGQAKLYFASHEGDLLVGAFVVHIGRACYYKDGGSVQEKSKLFASRYLHWFIIEDLKRDGFTSYDFCGFMNPKLVPDAETRGLYIFKTVFSHTIDFNNLAFEKRYKLAGLWPQIEKNLIRIYYRTKHELWY